MEVGHVIKVSLTNEILKRISEIDKNRFSLSTIEMPPVTKNRLKKNSKKKSSLKVQRIRRYRRSLRRAMHGNRTGGSTYSMS